MSKVLVIDSKKQALNPVHPGRARLLLTQQKAAVWRTYPFTIILKSHVEQPQVQPLRLKIDPGSKTTGMALVDDTSGEVVAAMELSHRGHQIKKSLDSRRAVRHSRRARQTRYRAPRWNNRKRPKGWLAPSLQSRIANVLTWVRRLQKCSPITAISMELVKFDLQQMDHPEISGIEYQQGTLQGYEVRGYLLEKWERTCVYCGKKEVPLQIEHIVARANGGTNRVSNLTLSCEKCNLAKGTKDIKEFLRKKPAVLKRVLATAKAPLKDAAAVNSTRWALYGRLKTLGLPIECGSGGLTKFHRTTRKLPKTHWLDACCVGKSTPEVLHVKGIVPLLITATGHGRRKMCNTDDLGFPTGHRQRRKRYFGYQTGDLVRAVVPDRFKCTGTHRGRVAVKAAGTFTIQTRHGKITDVPHRFCQPLHRSDGYTYHHAVRISPPPTSPRRVPVSSSAF